MLVQSGAGLKSTYFETGRRHEDRLLFAQDRAAHVCMQLYVYANRSEGDVLTYSNTNECSQDRELTIRILVDPMLVNSVEITKY